MNMKISTKVRPIHQLLPSAHSQMQWTLWFFIILSSLLILWIGYSTFERLGLFVGLLLTIALNFLIFIYGESPLLNFFRAEKFKGQDPWGLNLFIQQMSEKIEMPPPTLYIFESPSANGFTSGIPWKSPALALSSTLIKKLNDQERKTIITYLLVQMKTAESFWVGMASILANTLVGTAENLDKLWPVNFFFDQKQRPFLKLLAPWGWLLIRWTRPSHKYVSMDLLVSEILQDRRILAEVLWRLQGLAETIPLSVPACTSHLFIVNPESPEDPLFFERTHPSMKYRLEKLMGYYPI